MSKVWKSKQKPFRHSWLFRFKVWDHQRRHQVRADLFNVCFAEVAEWCQEYGVEVFRKGKGVSWYFRKGDSFAALTTSNGHLAYCQDVHDTRKITRRGKKYPPTRHIKVFDVAQLLYIFSMFWLGSNNLPGDVDDTRV